MDPDPDPFLTFIYNNVSLHCFIFLFSVMDVQIFNILDNILKFSGKKYILALLIIEMGTGTEPAK